MTNTIYQCPPEIQAAVEEILDLRIRLALLKNRTTRTRGVCAGLDLALSTLGEMTATQYRLFLRSRIAEAHADPAYATITDTREKPRRPKK